MSNGIDVDNLVLIDDVQRRGTSDFDLRYLEGQGKWEVSQVAFDALDLDQYAMSQYLSQEGDVILAIREREDATFLKGRIDSEKKSRLFTNRKLRNQLDQLGYEGVDLFALVPVGESEGFPLFLVDKWGDRELSPILEERIQKGREKRK